ncbi:MAG: metallophosphoesterase [Acidobacteriota bacterium]
MARYLRVLFIISLLLFFPFASIHSQSQSAPPPASAADSNEEEPSSGLRFAVVGDTGTGETYQLKIARQMLNEYKRRPFDFVLMMGDNIYGGDFKRIGQVFEEPYRALLERGVKFFATLGNHDIRCEQEEMTYPAFNMGGRRAYNFAPAGDLVEFFTIDSTSLLEGAHLDQLPWLEGALAASRARWKIAFFHHPPYSPGTRHGNNGDMISTVVPVLKRGSVRVVFTGHEHFFARLPAVDGIDYIISGAGGKLHKGGLRKAGKTILAGNDQLRHFLIVTLVEDQLSFAAIDENGRQIHRASIRLHP